MNYFLYILISFGFGGLVANFALKRIKVNLDQELKKIQDYQTELLGKINSEIKESKDYSNQILESVSDEYDHVITPLESRVQKKSKFFEKRNTKLQDVTLKLDTLKQDLKSCETKLHSINSSAIKELSQIAGISTQECIEEIKRQLNQEMQSYFTHESNSHITHLTDIVNKKSQELLKVIMQKYSEPSSTDKLDKFVELLSPKEALRIGGKDLQNYTYISEKLNVDIEINQYEANIVKVSGFILWKQEIAKSTLLKLSQLSHIDFSLIDKVITQSTIEMDNKLIKIGKKVANQIQITQLDTEFLKILGRLQFRTSYGQNILFHSFEVGYFSQIIADILGEDPRKAFLAGFFHDIGKAIDQEQEGSHDLLGKELLEKYGFDFEIYHPAHSHHNLVPVETILGEIVIIADKISAGRPGARTESAEMYYERVQGLERIAYELEGTKKAFAISAGREIRVYLDENKISDSKMPELAEQMAHQIESELTYPGQIKVNLIRAVESIEYANKHK